MRAACLAVSAIRYSRSFPVGRPGRYEIGMSIEGVCARKGAAFERSRASKLGPGGREKTTVAQSEGIVRMRALHRLHTSERRRNPSAAILDWLFPMPRGGSSAAAVARSNDIRSSGSERIGDEIDEKSVALRS